ncbi:MAG: PilZ domain-containing protein [Proteobacteria bacterium]|nr:PilZ domain-containing protein [Pseudomonadota bacterium]MBU1611208.1 PilZ domain-containing protein [Pseudomonadota bacterium]
MKQSDTVLVLTDKPALFGQLLSDIDKTGTYFPTASLLNKAMVTDLECCGIILDVKLVMTTSPKERDRLFSLAKGMPIVRARIDPEKKTPTLLDPLQCLNEQCEILQPAFRFEPRVKVRLEALWSMDSDPAMSETNEGVLLDISTNGSFLHTPHILPDEDYLHLRMLEIKKQRPVHCAVRWRRTDPGPGQFTGVGLKFIDLTDDQLAEIQSRFLKPIK